MVEIGIVYEGELRTACEHAPSSARLVTDAPVDNRGRGESFSPTDLLATALASCMATTMGIRAEDEGWPLAGSRVRIEKHMAPDPRRVSRLVVELELPAALDAAARSTLEHIAWNCPVKQSIHPDIELDVRFGYSR
jgi:putative redox protein